MAAHLKLPEGTLSSRLATGRQMLAKRLARHGLALPLGAVGLVLAENAAPACVPASVMEATIKAATPKAMPAIEIREINEIKLLRPLRLPARV